ncbi:Uncharacterised protein [Vibrio cholerae]|uniref:Uncharacterized protein n=1 Tax=Vibrio cholerae TaxID=666 RepID=A0A655U0D3_VIBCL|nr:Uncharacterised protein [Vibrio cholerae]CSB73378.1 Uncharacterised protein [Vibrio cholerae]CSD09277.1 Uncharacterised protein [Vibrio cholerae]CSD13442.1 Uncharacterised protein [Vibrio cholerae]
MLVVSFIAPSAVCAIEIPSLALRTATPKPRLCTFKRLEICRPAASSFALLILYPEDRRSIDDCCALVALVKYRCAVIADTLVFTFTAIVVSPIDFPT